MTGFLIFLIIVLIVVVLMQATKTLDLVGELRSDEKEEERQADIQGRLMILFMVLGMFGFFWCFGAYKYKLFPESGSAHGALLDNLFFWTLMITGVVFVITNIILFVFSYMYRWRNDRKAEHISHNNTLEVIWTVAPSVVLVFLVGLGLKYWGDITSDAGEDALVFEMTGQQFFWSSRYPGPDGTLGMKDFNLIDGNNSLGLVTPEFIDHKRTMLLGTLSDLRDREAALPGLIEDTEEFIEHHPNPRPVDSAKVSLKALKKEFKEIDATQKRHRAWYRRIKDKFTPEYLASPEVAPLIEASYDDFQPSELHLPVDREVEVRITAQDVLHNFYIPYMSVKMDAVPGIPTRFKFTPITTTEEMRDRIKDNPEWNRPDENGEPRWKNFVYEVACAEICGKGHNSMRYTLDVDQDEDYASWLTDQTAYFSQVEEMLKTMSEEEFTAMEDEYVYVEEDAHGDHHGDDHHNDDQHHGDEHYDEGGHASTDGKPVASK